MDLSRLEMSLIAFLSELCNYSGVKPERDPEKLLSRTPIAEKRPDG